MYRPIGSNHLRSTISGENWVRESFNGDGSAPRLCFWRVGASQSHSTLWPHPNFPPWSSYLRLTGADSWIPHVSAPHRLHGYTPQERNRGKEASQVIQCSFQIFISIWHCTANWTFQNCLSGTQASSRCGMTRWPSVLDFRRRASTVSIFTQGKLTVVRFRRVQTESSCSRTAVSI